MHPDAVFGHRTLRLKAPAGPLTLRYRARVRLNRPLPDLSAKEMAIEALPHEVLPDLMPTRYCESDRLGSAAVQVVRRHRARLHARAGGVRLDPRQHRVPRRLDRLDDDGVRRVPAALPACAATSRTWASPSAVRSNIPARLAVGYARFDEPPPDFHAVFEAFIGGHWELFDPTRLTEPQDLVRIAVGRDAGDVAFATLFGSVRTRLIRPEVEQVRRAARR